ncbi:MAG: DinB family protein [Planktotalea sp.]|uniref:DinB family protein n=1 Tax=Planktotalea sp. TaxID=2029877 RepID=UPI003C72F57F
MARYNAWQNQLLTKALEALPETELKKERKAFFGSIFATANHLLWGDTLWISRFDGGQGPDVSDLTKVDTTTTTASLTEWSIARFKTDARFNAWAKSLSNTGLAGDLTWFSGSVQRDITKSRASCVVQMFNHQTHHRGQIHAMLGAAGGDMYVTDIPFMPE